MSQAKKAFIGSLTLTFSRLSERLLGLVSTLVLARLLLPQDFGIVAISLLVVGGFSVISNTGSGSYIIQKEKIHDDDLNTAWTLDIIVKNGIFVLLLFAAPYAADYYNDQRLASVIPILSLMLVLSSFSNPAFMLLRREQSYGAIFKLDIAKKVCAVTVMVITAIIYQNYWAMVVGHLTSNFIQLVGSYWIVKYRPSFSLKGVLQQWQFTKWMLSKGLLGYARSQLDTFLVSKYFGLPEVGAYHVMKYISTMPGSQIIEPATNPLLATFSRSKKDLDALQHQFKLTLVVIMALALPLSAYLYSFSLPVVSILLGEKWIDHHGVFAILSLLTFSLAIGSLSSQIIVSTGKIKSLFYYDLLTVLLMGALLVSIQVNDIQIFALYRVAFDWIMVILLMAFAMKKVLKITIGYFIGLFLLSSFVAVISSIVAKAVYIENLNVFISLIISSFTFLLCWLLLNFMSYKIYLHKTKEGAHLAFIFNKVIKKLPFIKQLKSP